jgi:hypothetical protein
MRERRKETEILECVLDQCRIETIPIERQPDRGARDGQPEEEARKHG